LVLSEAEHYAIILSDFASFRTGVTFTMLLRFSRERFDLRRRPGEPPRFLFEGTDPFSPRLGIGFADGRKVVLGPPPDSWREAIRPVLVRSGGRGDKDWQAGYLWLSPLPPVGPMTFTVVWEAMALAERTVTVEANELVEASELAHKPG
jgi:hypothetical protein